jgi:hypothetical protein
VHNTPPLCSANIGSIAPVRRNLHAPTMEQQMLTLKQLQKAKINPAAAREAYIQVDRYLLDVLDVRKSFEQKAATLMGAFITISLALFGIGGAIFKESGAQENFWPFFVAGFVFLLGAGCYIVSLKVGIYAAVGSRPEMWLNKGVIDGGENAVAQMLAYLTFHHSERIATSLRGNELKARWIDGGMILGALGPLVFVVLFLVL